jgi:hypothetical protein
VIEHVTQEMVDAAKIVRDAADKAWKDLDTQLYRQKEAEHARKSRAALPQTCNHGKLVKVDNIGPHSSGYYYHVVEDGNGGWKPANDGTNYCDNWPNKA